MLVIYAGSHSLLEREFESYITGICIPVEDDPLLWWGKEERSKPIMAALARRYLCLTGSSAPCERVFSMAGNVVTDRRANLSPTHANQLVFLAMSKRLNN